MVSRRGRGRHHAALAMIGLAMAAAPGAPFLSTHELAIVAVIALAAVAGL